MVACGHQALAAELRQMLLAIRHRPGWKTVVTPMTYGVAPVTTRADPALVKALARASRYQRMLDEGRYASITEMATAERIERGYLGSLLRLTLLAPDIVSAILDGRQPEEMTLSRLMEPFPLEWERQFGHASASLNASLGLAPFARGE